MPEIDDGGPAFPTEEFTPYHGGGGQIIRRGGMSLRDWFAGQALVGLLARGCPLTLIALEVGVQADAMLAERAKRHG